MTWIKHLAIAALLAPSVVAQNGSPTALERFQLYNECRPVGLVVEPFPRDAKKIGLSEKDVWRLAESRLRAARLYTPVRGPMLYVTVNVMDRAFSVSLAYLKWVTDKSGLSGPATTWSVRGLGTHASGATYIKSGLSDYLDEFLNEYLRVNAQACGDPSP